MGTASLRCTHQEREFFISFLDSDVLNLGGLPLVNQESQEEAWEGKAGVVFRGTKESVCGQCELMRSQERNSKVCNYGSEQVAAQRGGG